MDKAERDFRIKRAQPNPNGELICCLGCGRDTWSKDGYCNKCIGQSSHFNSQINDRKDRHRLNVSLIDIDEDDIYEIF